MSATRDRNELNPKFVLILYSFNIRMENKKLTFLCAND